jgi:hypothetical protein
MENKEISEEDDDDLEKLFWELFMEDLRSAVKNNDSLKEEEKNENT